jgi:hypothetical protein
MGDHRACDAAEALGEDRGEEFALLKFAPQRHEKTDDGVEMCAGDRSENRDQHNQNRARWNGVGEELYGHIFRELCRHNAGANDGCDKQSRAKIFSDEALGEALGETWRQCRGLHYHALA